MSELYYSLDGHRLMLMHHGIKGQKWGVRNAEWYPIDAYNRAKGIVSDAVHSPAAAKAGEMAKSAGKATKSAAVTVAKGTKKAAKAYGEHHAAKKAEDFEKKKKRILTSGTPGEILSIADKLTNEELNYARNRNSLLNDLKNAEHTRVKQVKEAEFRKKWGKIMDFGSSIKMLSDPIDNVATAVERYKKFAKAFGFDEDSKEKKANKEKEKREKDIKKAREEWFQRATPEKVIKNQQYATNKEITDYWLRRQKLRDITKWDAEDKKPKEEKTESEGNVGSSKRHYKNPPEIREAMRIAKAKGWDALTRRQKDLLNELG